ncbi:iron-containing alcohol dehydrogenase family protein [Fibrobacter sp. UWB3]|uniref:iron-containing alcohol dehydrogenase family protein n=1 Tax=Fibrobacter sp. UWB3 TaxID=1964357 RepID=UPI000B51E997|nr:iron-containing alcohol dehydrogenase family protein [Fibrobacter sp. UWB3]OWV15682.1 alcohol dehydrogenase [Fibrobacter sp. UWB3]
MQFYVPTDIYVEKECVKNHAKDLLAVGKRALIVTGHSSAKANGSLNDVTEVLNAGGVAYQIFDEVEENPSTDTVGKGAKIAREFGAEFIIGIGGGSAIDAAKAMAILLVNPELDADELHKAPSHPLNHAPVVAVPTTCGTGSEATPVAIITNHKINLKKSIPHRIFPVLALVDGKYLASAKKQLIVNTAVDALAHMVESILNVHSNMLNRMCPEYGLKLWGECKEALLASENDATKNDSGNAAPARGNAAARKATQDAAPIDASLYEKLMYTSTIAGMSIAMTSTAVPHGMSYDLTLSKGTPHGPAVGYFLAAYVEVCQKKVPADVEKILSLLGLKNVEEFAKMLRKLIGTCTVTRELRDKFATAMKTNHSKLDLVPGGITPDEVEYIYDKSLVVK